MMAVMTKEPVMKTMPTTTIFQPWRAKKPSWSATPMPANAPTSASGAVRLITPTEAITKSRTGLHGPATSRPRIET